jgi:hypothetical protein
VCIHAAGVGASWPLRGRRPFGLSTSSSRALGAAGASSALVARFVAASLRPPRASRRSCALLAAAPACVDSRSPCAVAPSGWSTSGLRAGRRRRAHVGLVSASAPVVGVLPPWRRRRVRPRVGSWARRRVGGYNSASAARAARDGHTHAPSITRRRARGALRLCGRTPPLPRCLVRPLPLPFRCATLPLHAA